MKVFQIIPHLDVGGCERVALNIAESQSAGIEYHVVEVYRGRGAVSDALAEELKAAGVILHRAPRTATSPKAGILLFPFWFPSLAKASRPDIVHCHNEISLLAYYLSCKLSCRRRTESVVETIHSCQLWNGWKRVGKVVEHFYQVRGKQVAVSTAVAQMYSREFGYEPEVIYNGVRRQEAKPFPHLVSGRINILFAARMEEQKGVKTLIDVASSPSLSPNLHFHVVGDGPMKPTVDKALSGFGNVSLYHRVHNIASYIESFDYVFMPSLFEGLPMLSIESSMAGTPVIGNDCPSIVESLPERWPLLVHDNNVNDYLSIFSTLENADRKELSEKAREYAQRQFSIERMQGEYEKMYLEQNTGPRS